jgi:2-polyprenyl-6-methoxyphenol hydroxylase-like FAD-dependent oxidoreductase
MATAPDLYLDSVSTIEPDSWSRGRITLLGDAGYCPSSLSGMGTGLAVVGAYVLAGELAQPAATTARRSPGTRASCGPMWRAARGSAGLMVPSSRLGATFVQLNLRLLPLLAWLRDLPAKMARRTATAITLPSYRG